MLLYHLIILVRVWGMTGEGVDMGEELGAWFSSYLGKEGLHVYYMSPQHKPRVLSTDTTWGDISRHDDEVSITWIIMHKFCTMDSC